VPTTDPNASPPTTPVKEEKPLEYGADIRLRDVVVPQGLLELFVDRASGGTSALGIGLDIVRRRGNLELQLGFEYEHTQPPEGVWIDKGANVAGGDEADYMCGPDSSPKCKELGWFTIEFTFLNHAEFNKYLAFRYGGGVGLGIITGGLQKYDVACGAGATNDNPLPGCKPASLGGTGTDTGGGPNDYNIPPVFPVVNAIIGLQIRPVEKAVINIEAGIRTIPFFGISAGYFFL
jgi:hypothetical protein